MGTSKVNLSEVLFYRGARPLLAVVLLSLAVASYLGMLTPKLILDLGANYGTDAFYTTINSLFWLFVCTYINRVAYQITLSKYVQHLVVNIRTQCYTRWLLNYDIQTGRHSIAERYPQGEVVSRVVTDTESVRELMTSGTVGIVIDACFVVASLASFIFINEKIGASLGIFLSVASAMLFWGSKYIREIFHAMRRARGYVHRVLANLIGGFAETYYTDHGRYAEKTGQKVFDDFLRTVLRSNFWDAGYYSLAESLYPLTLLFAALIFPYSGISEAAIVLATVDIIQKSINPIKDIASKIANVQRAIAGIQRIDEFFGDLAKGESSPIEFESREIRFEKLVVQIGRFTYPTSNGRSGGFSLSDIEFSGKTRRPSGYRRALRLGENRPFSISSPAIPFPTTSRSPSRRRTGTSSTAAGIPRPPSATGNRLGLSPKTRTSSPKPSNSISRWAEEPKRSSTPFGPGSARGSPTCATGAKNPKTY